MKKLTRIRNGPSAAAAAAGMTLLELLVVVATSALLMGVLLPALGAAREEGRAASCAGTLHNLGVATTLYLQDNEDAFWPYFVDVVEPEGGGRLWWFGFEAGGPPAIPRAPHRPLDKAEGFLARYLTGTSADFRCASFPYGEGKYFPKFSPAAGGYGYNTAALGGYDQTDATRRQPRRLQEFTGQTSDIFVLADGIHFDRLDYSGQGLLEQSFNEPAYVQWQDPTFYASNVGVNGGYGHFRHNRRAAVLYMDAHAALQPVRQPLHPYSGKGYGLVANLSDESRRLRQIVRGPRVLAVDLIYGLK